MFETKVRKIAYVAREPKNKMDLWLHWVYNPRQLVLEAFENGAWVQIAGGRNTTITINHEFSVDTENPETALQTLTEAAEHGDIVTVFLEGEINDESYYAEGTYDVFTHTISLVRNGYVYLFDVNTATGEITYIRRENLIVLDLWCGDDAETKAHNLAEYSRAERPNAGGRTNYAGMPCKIKYGSFNYFYGICDIPSTTSGTRIKAVVFNYNYGYKCFNIKTTGEILENNDYIIPRTDSRYTIKYSDLGTSSFGNIAIANIGEIIVDGFVNDPPIIHNENNKVSFFKAKTGSGNSTYFISSYTEGPSRSSSISIKFRILEFNHTTNVFTLLNDIYAAVPALENYELNIHAEIESLFNQYPGLNNKYFSELIENPLDTQWCVDYLTALSTIMNNPPSEWCVPFSSADSEYGEDVCTIASIWNDTQDKYYIKVITKKGHKVYILWNGEENYSWYNNSDDFGPLCEAEKPNWEAEEGQPGFINNKPELAAVATSGDYGDLNNSPALASVATSGSYNDLIGTPALAAVATSGSYNDLSNQPSIPAAQVNADWSANSGVEQILNKPSDSEPILVARINDYNNKIYFREITQNNLTLGVSMRESSISYENIQDTPTPIGEGKNNTINILWAAMYALSLGRVLEKAIDDSDPSVSTLRLSIVVTLTCIIEFMTGESPSPALEPTDFSTVEDVLSVLIGVFEVPFPTPI